MDLHCDERYDRHIKGNSSLENYIMGGYIMKKKILAAIMAATMVFSLTACGGAKDTASTDTTTKEESIT